MSASSSLLRSGRTSSKPSKIYRLEKNILMRARKSAHRNPLPMIFIIDIIVDFLVPVE
jgi:hypothetical protein